MQRRNNRQFGRLVSNVQCKRKWQHGCKEYTTKIENKEGEEVEIVVPQCGHLSTEKGFWYCSR